MFAKILGICGLLGLLAPALLVAGPASAVELAPATARSYYVDCSKSARGNGSETAPWSRLSAVNTHGAFRPGEQILLRRGTSCVGRLLPSGSGSAAAPIVLGAYGSGAKPSIDGRGTPGSSGTVFLLNLQHWTIQDLRITNRAPRSTTAYRAGILLQNTGVGRLAGLTVRRLDVVDVVSNPAGGDSRRWGGIVAFTSGGRADGFDGLVIQQNRVSRIGRTGIAVFNTEWPASADRDVRLTGNVISHARGDAVILFGAKKSRIDHNVSAYAADLWPCSQCMPKNDPLWANAAIWTTRASQVRIDHNEAYGTKADGGDGEGFDIDMMTKNVVMEYNYSHNNDGGGLLLCGSANAVVRFNVFENDKKSAIAFIGNFHAKSTSIYNNTFYASAGSKAGVVRTFNGKYATNTRFFNNVVYNYGTGRFGWPSPAWTRANTVVGTRAFDQPTDQLTSRVNPRLVAPGSGKIGIASLGGYRLQRKVSKRVGISIPSSVTRDYFGRRIDPARPPRGVAG